MVPSLIPPERLLRISPVYSPVKVTPLSWDRERSLVRKSAASENPVEQAKAAETAAATARIFAIILNALIFNVRIFAAGPGPFDVFPLKNSQLTSGNSPANLETGD